MPDPGLYIDEAYHQVTKRYVRKFAEKEDIDAMCAENFEIYMNFMVCYQTLKTDSPVIS